VPTRWLCAGLVVVGCAEPAPLPAVAEVVELEQSVGVADVSWRWSDRPDLFPLVAVRTPGELPRYVLSPPPTSDAPARLRREDATGDGWTVKLPTASRWREGDGGAVVTAGDRVFVAHWAQISSGCELMAVSIADGSVLWVKTLTGLGPIEHSKYRTDVQLSVADGDPVVFGHESSGRYIERRDGATGALMQNTVLPGAPVAPNVGAALLRDVLLAVDEGRDYAVGVDEFLERHALASSERKLGEAVRTLDGHPLLSGGRLAIGLRDGVVKARRR
jgi:outer membrane protein assembly factor BamB